MDRLCALTAGLTEGRGRSLLIGGEPGIGKSSLIEATLAAVDRDRVEIAYGECDELGRRFPLSVMLAALGVDVRSPDRLRAETAAALAGRAAPAPSAAPVAFEFEGDDFALTAVERLMELVDRLCAARPLLLAVDDLQFADEASLLLWTRLSRAAERLPLLLLGACRPNPPRTELDALRADLARSGHGELMSLRRLAGAQVLDLAETSIGRRPGPRITRLLETAAGNPLYTYEILDAAMRSGTLEQAGDVADVSGTGQDAGRGCAASLTDAIMDRLSFLTSECRELLQTAAVRGMEFGTADLAAPAGLEIHQVESALADAVRAGVLEGAGQAMRFRHGLIRQALYNSIPEAVRLAMHRDVALNLIERDALPRLTAEAVLRALPVADGWESDRLAANIEALLVQAPAAAAELLEHSIAHGLGTDTRVSAFEDRLPAALISLDRFEETEQAARRILAATTDPHRRGPAAWNLATALIELGRAQEALALVTAEAAETGQTPLWRSRMRVQRAMILSRTGGMDEGARIAREVLDGCEGPENDPFTVVHALRCLLLERGNKGDPQGSVEYTNRALDIVEGRPDLMNMRLHLLLCRLVGYELVGRYDEALTDLNRARTLVDQSSPKQAVTLHTQAAAFAFNRGDWNDALTELEAVRGITSDFDDPLAEAISVHMAVQRGETATARRHARELERRLGAHGSLEPIGAAALALLAEHSGHPEQAVEILADTVRRGDPRRWGRMAEWMPYLASTALSVGDADTARLALETARADTAGGTSRFEKVMCEWCRGLVENDPAPVLAAAGFFRRADHFRLALGRSLEDAAFLLAGMGETDRAKEAFEGALSVYGELGAGWASQRAISRLRTRGIRLGVRGPRRRARTGWEALSDTERTVALLVADGLSNPDIAARLMLSRRTIQTHVAHIMAKLGVRSRREIAAPAEV